MNEQTKISEQNIAPIHSCVTCLDCADRCGFFHNEVRIIVDGHQLKVIGLDFDPSTAVCFGECRKACVTDFNIMEWLKNTSDHER